MAKRVYKYQFAPKQTEGMNEQIEATIWLFDAHIIPLDENQRDYIRRSLSNLVTTCLHIATEPTPELP